MHIAKGCTFSSVYAEGGSLTLTHSVRVHVSVHAERPRSSRALESPASTGPVIVLQSPTWPKLSDAAGRYTRGASGSLLTPLARGKTTPATTATTASDPPRLGSTVSPRHRHQIASRVHTRGYAHAVTSTCNVSPTAPAREILLFLFLTTLFFTEDINSCAHMEEEKGTERKKRTLLRRGNRTGLLAGRCSASRAHLFRSSSPHPSPPLGRGRKGGARLQVAPRAPDVSN
jgi:hypothetical protein